MDTYLGATEPSVDRDQYGGPCHLRSAARKPVPENHFPDRLLPRRRLDTYITLDALNEAYLFNPRNCYQNYAAAVNTSDRTLYTYMGVLKPRMGNVNYPPPVS